MTHHERQWLDAENEDAAHGDRSRQRRGRPRSHNVNFARQRRGSNVSLGMNARCGRRSTYRSFSRGQLYTSVASPSSASSRLTSHNATDDNVVVGQL